MATAAAVLGFVAAGLTVLFSLSMIAVLSDGEGDPTIVVLLLGLPCAAGEIAGGVRLLRRGSPALLFGSALAALAVLAVALVLAFAVLDQDALYGRLVFVGLALPLAVTLAVFARLPTVRGWAAAGR